MAKERRIGLFITVLLMGTLLITACAGSTSPQESASEASAQLVVDADDHEDGDDHEAEEPMEDDHEDGDDHEEEEHMEGENDPDHAHAEVPHEYEDLENPFIDDATALAAGAELFAANCTSCHGDTGMGDGPAAVALDPKPASLSDGMMMNDLSDTYIFWRITEGSMAETFNSAMPPWETVFSEEQRWQLVNYIRSLSQ